MFHILLKELNNFFNSPIAYIVIGVFLTGVGLFVWVFPQSSILDGQYAQLDTLFSLTPYVYMFLIPAIAMRTFAEEKKTGTMELLVTKPLTDMQIVLGKYFASLLLVFFSILPTIIYYCSVYQLGSPKGNIDSAAVFGSYIGLVLLGGVFTALGIFASSLTSNQIGSFIVAVFLCFILYEGLGSVAAIDAWSPYAEVLSYLAVDKHYDALSRGLIDSRNIVYLMSLSGGLIYATCLVLSSRKW